MTASEQSDGALESVAAEQNTLYVVPGDVLLLPAVAGQFNKPGWDKLAEHFGLQDIVLHGGLDAPWILRRAVTPGVPPVSDTDRQ